MKKPDSKRIIIEQIRKQIDLIDDQIINLLLKRFRLSRKIGILKNKTGTSIIDTGREQQIFERLLKRVKDSLLDRQLIMGIWKNIIKKSYQVQRQVPNGNKNRNN
jgi:monofunctional chorismate mutase